MFKVYDDSNFVINYQDNLEKLVTNFVSYYKNNINELFKKFYLDSINKMEIRLFSDKSLLGDIPYKLGDFAGFFNDKGVNCYINMIYVPFPYGRMFISYYNVDYFKDSNKIRSDQMQDL